MTSRKRNSAGLNTGKNSKNGTTKKRKRVSLPAELVENTSLMKDTEIESQFILPGLEEIVPQNKSVCEELEEELPSPPFEPIGEIAHVHDIPEPSIEVEIPYRESDFVSSVKGVQLSDSTDNPEPMDDTMVIQLHLEESEDYSNEALSNITTVNLYEDLDGIPVETLPEKCPLTRESDETRDVAMLIKEMEKNTVKEDGNKEISSYITDDLNSNVDIVVPVVASSENVDPGNQAAKEVIGDSQRLPVDNITLAVNPTIRQPKQVVYVFERLREPLYWKALITHPPRTGLEDRRCLPTHWIPANSSYMTEFRNLRAPNEGNTLYECLSSYDNAFVTTEVLSSGEVYITRFGQRARIRSAVADRRDSNRLGGQRYFPKLQQVEIPLSQQKPPCHQRRRKKCPGYPTDEIPLECPYWAKLVRGLSYPEKGAIPYKTNSTVDKVRCLIFIEANGRVQATRNGVRVELLPPFNSQ